MSDTAEAVGVGTGDGAPRQWLVVRKRDTEPCEVNAFDRYDEAAMFFDRVQAQWSTVYFCRVVHCEGHPLDITPVVIRFRERAEKAEAEVGALSQRQEALTQALQDVPRYAILDPTERCIGVEAVCITGPVGAPEEFEDALGWQWLRWDHVVDALAAALAGAPSTQNQLQHLFNHGDFALHAGGRSSFKIDCDALTDADLKAVAELLFVRLPRFGRVEGVPRGGLRLAAALEPYATAASDRLLLVDDVVTTGASLEAQRAGRSAIGAAIFSRGTPPPWVTVLFEAGESLKETPK